MWHDGDVAAGRTGDNPYRPPRTDDPPPAIPTVPGARPARPVQGLAITLAAALAVVGLTTTLHVIALFARIADIREWIAEEPASPFGAASFYDAHAPSMMLPGALVLATIVLAAALWLPWSLRCSHNLRALGVSGMTHEPNATVWWWFIPIANLWLPFAITRELWQASAAASDGVDATGYWRRRSVPAFFYLWWLAWVARTILAGVAARMSDGSLNELLTIEQYTLASELCSLVAVAPAIAVALSISRRQTAALERARQPAA